MSIQLFQILSFHTNIVKCICKHWLNSLKVKVRGFYFHAMWVKLYQNIKLSLNYVVQNVYSIISDSESHTNRVKSVSNG